MRFLRRSLTGLLLLAAVLALLGLAAILLGDAVRQGQAPGGPAMSPQERVVAANVVRLVPAVVTPRLTAFGKVEARRVLELRSRQAGRVVWVAAGFRNGLGVAAGEVLVRLDPAPAREAVALAAADLAEARAAVAAAAAALTLAEADLAAAEAQAVLRARALVRQQDLLARGVGADQAVETAELAASAADQAVLARRQALATARARVDQTAVAVTRAGIALGEAERALSETALVAGLSGRVDGVALVEGALVGANEVLGRIVDPAALDVAVRLSTAQAALLVRPDGSLNDGAVKVLPGGAAGGLTGRLDRLGTAVEAGQTGRLLYVAVDEGPGVPALLQPGDFVAVGIAEPPLAGAARLPATALGRDDTVLALGPGDRLEEVAVEVLRRQGDDIILAVGPLAGREVVTERSALLGAGIRIRPIRPAPPDHVTLTPERRAALIALVEADPALSETQKAALLHELQRDAVATETLDRLEGRMDG